MNVISTRNSQKTIPAAQALLNGIAEDGGLYVPGFFPRIDLKKAVRLSGEGYAALSAYVMSLFFDMGEDSLIKIASEAYAGFDDDTVAPMRELTGGEYVMELHHGPTLAFKDMALQVLPRLISAALDACGSEKDVLVLTATSGDTGKAALEGFKDVGRTAIEVFYPAEGVSALQKLQMVTQEGGNTDVCAVRGNFDDAQTGVKRLFMDAQFREGIYGAGYTLSSANSINIGRLVPQVAYYVWAYAWLVANGRIETGESVNFCVPTGNFGNILAAYYAKRIGVPVGRADMRLQQKQYTDRFFPQGRVRYGEDVL
jgi:threonine synthase